MYICTKCKIEKPTTEFYFRNSQGSHHSWCKGCLTLSRKEYKIKNKEKISQSAKEYFIKNKKRIQEYRSTRLELHSEYMKNWRRNNPGYQVSYIKNRLKNDPTFRLVHSLRTYLRSFIKYYSDNSQYRYGGKRIDIIAYLEQTIPDGFTLDNYFNRKKYPDELKLEIDHIKPFQYFIDNGGLTDESIAICMHYKNLRLTPMKQNRIKHKNY